MTTKPRANKFRVRRGQTPATAATEETVETEQPAQDSAPSLDPNVSTADEVTAETDLDNIRKEGLTGRQLRMARRIAQKHWLAVTSDFDAVRQLRLKGIDPFERSSILELVASGGSNTPPPRRRRTRPAPRWLAPLAKSSCLRLSNRKAAPLPNRLMIAASAVRLKSCESNRKSPCGGGKSFCFCSRA